MDPIKTKVHTALQIFDSPLLVPWMTYMRELLTDESTSEENQAIIVTYISSCGFAHSVIIYQESSDDSLSVDEVFSLFNENKCEEVHTLLVFKPNNLRHENCGVQACYRIADSEFLLGYDSNILRGTCTNVFELTGTRFKAYHADVMYELDFVAKSEAKPFLKEVRRSFDPSFYETLFDDRTKSLRTAEAPIQTQ